MNVYAISALVNVVTSIVLGLLVLFSNSRLRVNQAFAAFAASVAFWSFAYFQWQIATDYNTALLWTHLLMAGAIFITPVYFHFVMYFLGIQHEKRYLIAGGYVFIMIFTLLNWTPSYIIDVGPQLHFTFWPIAGPLFSVFLVVWVVYAILPVFFLLTRMSKARGDERSAIQYIIAGTIIGYAGGCTNYFLWYQIPILPFGNISASLYLILVAYAIMKHRLFNMKVIATELLTFSLWLFIFVRMLLADNLGAQLADAGLLFFTLIAGVLLIRSVDKEVALRELIEKQEQELEVVNKQQENLLHFISHEIKGYLTKSQGGFAGIVEGDYGEIGPKLKEMATTALADVRKGVATVMQILEASNMKRGTVRYAKKLFDLKNTVRATVADLKSSAEEKNLKIEVTIGEGKYVMTGDEERMRGDVVRNLIDNAIKYSPSGTILITLTDGDKIRFSVKDNGIGITPEDMDRLFTEGGHGKDSIKINVHSTGYGLYIAKQIVEAHGGKIWAESEGAGKGATFLVELPTP